MWVFYIFLDYLVFVFYKVWLFIEGMFDSLFVIIMILELLLYKRWNRLMEFLGSRYCLVISIFLFVNVYKINRFGENFNIYVGVIYIFCVFYMICIFYVNLFIFYCN